VFHKSCRYFVFAFHLFFSCGATGVDGKGISLEDMDGFFWFSKLEYCQDFINEDYENYVDMT